jgi:hypothetical protein
LKKKRDLKNHLKIISRVRKTLRMKPIDIITKDIMINYDDKPRQTKIYIASEN